MEVNKNGQHIDEEFVMTAFFDGHKRAKRENPLFAPKMAGPLATLTHFRRKEMGGQHGTYTTNKQPHKSSGATEIERKSLSRKGAGHLARPPVTVG